MIKKQSIENLKSRIDIVDVISNYIEVKKYGTSFKACCPFHSEKSPSFAISEKGFYKCFGCGATGDAIKFVQEFEHLDFIDAVVKIADFYNFELELEKNSEYKRDNFEILELLNNFYKRNFDLNNFAKEYIKNRGIADNIAEKFNIGYAPDSKLTIDFLKSKDINLNDAIEVGAIAKDRDFYARFINRITFPIFNPNGKIIGFGGRAIANHPAKYINSPQSRIFNKSNTLYGYNFANDEIHKKNEIVVVEGYIDVIMLHQIGIKNVVATLGTALTNEHLPLLHKTNPKLILAYDGDSAGINAGVKASKMLKNFDGGVVIFSDNLDPADMVKNQRDDELRKILKTPKPFIEFVLEDIAKKYDLKNPFNKEKALNEAIEFLKGFSEIVKNEYKTFLSFLLKIDAKLIKFEDESVDEVKKELKAENLTTISMMELEIIKTLIEQPILFDLIVDRCDEKLIFKNYLDEIELIKMEDLNNPKLLEILLNEKIKTCLNENEVQKNINILIANLYESDLKRLKKVNINIDDKVFYMQKIINNIERLKKGELMVYEELNFS